MVAILEFVDRRICFDVPRTGIRALVGAVSLRGRTHLHLYAILPTRTIQRKTINGPPDLGRVCSGRSTELLQETAGGNMKMVRGSGGG